MLVLIYVNRMMAFSEGSRPHALLHAARELIKPGSVMSESMTDKQAAMNELLGEWLWSLYHIINDYIVMYC